MQTTTPVNTEVAWEFATSHLDKIERLIRRFGPNHLEPHNRDAYVNDVLLRVVEKHGKYDPEKSAPVTWIVWQMRAVTTYWHRDLKYRRRESVDLADDDTRTTMEYLDAIAVDPDSWGGVDHAHQDLHTNDALCAVSAIYAEADKAERLLIRSYLEGWDAREVRRRCGISKRERDACLRTLRRYVTTTTGASR